MNVRHALRWTMAVAAFALVPWAPADLIAHWEFNARADALGQDSSGRGNDAVVTGARAVGPGPEKALLLDGNASAEAIPKPPGAFSFGTRGDFSRSRQ